MDANYAYACCDVARQYYRLTLEEGRVATDFTLCEAPPDKLRALGRGKIVTGDKLLPCPVCGGRGVAGCDCVRRAMPCEQHLGFRFSCIYCKHLRLLGASDAK